MKIEAVIVAWARFLRVLGKLNCTVQNCPVPVGSAGLDREESLRKTGTWN